VSNEIENLLFSHTGASLDLLKSEGHLRIILDGISDGVMVHDAAGQVLFANAAAARLSGYPSVDDLLSADPLELVRQHEFSDAEDHLLPFDQRPVRRALRGEAVPETLLKIREVDTSRIRWALIRSTPVFDETGQLHSVISTFRDITEHKEAEMALQKRAEELGALYEAGRLLGSTLDPERIYDTVRELIAGMMECDSLIVSSYDPSDNLIRCAYAWVEGERLDASRLPPIPLAPEGKGMQSTVIRTGEPLFIGDMIEGTKRLQTRYYVDPDGTVADKPREDAPTAQSGLMVPVKLEGRVVGVAQIMSTGGKYAYTMDHLRLLETLMLQVAASSRNALLYQQAKAEIEERKRAEEELAAKQGQIEALNARLQRAMTETHHRVKNNLQVIAAMVDLQVMDGEETVPKSELHRLSAYISTLAAVHEILTEEAREEAELQFISARAMIEKLLPLIRQTSAGQSIEAQITTDPRLPARQGTSLALIMNELVSNALKHGGRNIVVKLSQAGSRVVLEVSDDGPGFPDGFDAKKNANTGLELVENLSRWDLGGEALYENMDGKGANVVVSFPLKQ
jgi:PAS domain S-box-containing protein